MTRSRRERGMVTAELAAITPFALVFVLMLVWVGSLGIAQVRLVDAAREGARLVARGEPEAKAASVTRRLAPAGATVRVRSDRDGTVTVDVLMQSRPPLPFGTTVGSKTLSASAVAALEEP